jgi:hypothetical protein
MRHGAVACARRGLWLNKAQEGDVRGRRLACGRAPRRHLRAALRAGARS